MNGLKETIQLREKDEMSSSDLVTELNDKLTSQVNDDVITLSCYLCTPFIDDLQICDIIDP